MILITPFIGTLALSCIAPATGLLPVAGHALSSTGSVALHARFDPSLGALRAGRVEAPASFGAGERIALRAAQQHSPALASLRGGFMPTDSEWGWVAIGAGVVLLIVLL